jgi:hypothetical protein
MTICISALADDGKAIVCVADKMLSFGDLSQGQLQLDSNVTKMIPINSGRSLVLCAGTLAICREVISEIGNKSATWKAVKQAMRDVEAVYKEAFDRNQRIEILQQRGLTKANYQSLLASAGNNSSFLDIYDKMSEYALDCDLTICGFDDRKKPFIICAVSPGIVRDQTLDGCHAIGIASKEARARLLWSGFDRKHSVGRVLFDSFDAKATVEKYPSIGFEWDTQVMFPDSRMVVPKKTKKFLIEAAWETHNRSPFEKWDPDEHLPEPEVGWQERILNLSRSDLEPI